MEFTGERFVPSLRGDIRLEHFHRYHWCSSFASNKHVLDIASGEGYGSNLLASVADSVIGVDISPEAVAHAQSIYGDKSNLTFLHGSAAQIPLPNKSIDLVVSFETIEHHTQHEEMISEIKRVLTDDGMLIISSPNKKIYSDLAGGHHNHFHVKELYFSELASLLSSFFSSVKYLGQRATATSLLQPLEPQISFDFTKIYTETCKGIEERTPSNIEPMYYLAIATNSAQPLILNSTSLFSEVDNPLEDRTIEIIKLGTEIQRMSNYIEEVHGVLAKRDQELHEIKSSALWKLQKLLNFFKS